MFGVPMDNDHATNIFCDDESVVKNSTRLESMFNKKHNSIACYYTRWNCAACIVTISWIRSKENLADPFTKKLSAPVRAYLLHFPDQMIPPSKVGIFPYFRGNIY